MASSFNLSTARVYVSDRYAPTWLTVAPASSSNDSMFMVTITANEGSSYRIGNVIVSVTGVSSKAINPLFI